MQQLVDRTEELASLDGFLTQARASASPVVVTIEGVSGIGKTALLEAFVARAQEHMRVARLRARRLEHLSTGTLEDDLRSGAQIVAIDDAQWCNRSTEELLIAALGDGRIRMLVLARDDGPMVPGVAVDHRIVLAPLASAFIERIARVRAPALSSTQVEAVVQRAGGSPYEAIELARFDDEATSAASAIARFVSRLPLSARTIAQMIALIAAPVEIEFLRMLWRDSRELGGALDLLAPLLERSGDTIEFDHLLSGAAVVETIPMKIPLHRRIVAALERGDRKSLRDRILLLEQLLGSGDREPAREAALDLALEAAHANAPYAQLWASARHVELGEPGDAQFVAFYTHYLEALSKAAEHGHVEAIASHALSEAQRRQLRFVAPMVAQLIRAQWAGERYEAAQASYERYVGAFADSKDQALLRAAAPWLRAS